MESSVHDEGDDDEFWAKFEGVTPEDDDEDEPDIDSPLETGDKELFRLSDAGGFEKVAEGLFFVVSPCCCACRVLSFFWFRSSNRGLFFMGKVVLGV